MRTTNGFQTYIKRWYLNHGRHELPWRQTTNPYAILVSELMLQQTQVERVIPKYLAFMKAFPEPLQLAKASQIQALRLWQGLDYNRRILNLKKTASILANSDASFPFELDDLTKLPGIGPYTASAIRVFAFNLPSVVIETNIRTVFLYHFFSHSKEKVADSKLLPLIEQTQDVTNPREWYAALMDYGSFLKKMLPNPSRQSKQHTLQSNFATSKRKVRGEILKSLTLADALTKIKLKESITGDVKHFETALKELEEEGFIKALPDGWKLQE